MRMSGLFMQGNPLPVHRICTGLPVVKSLRVNETSYERILTFQRVKWIPSFWGTGKLDRLLLRRLSENAQFVPGRLCAPSLVARFSQMKRSVYHRIYQAVGHAEEEYPVLEIFRQLKCTVS